LNLKWRKWREAGEDYIMRSFIIYASPNIRVIYSRKIKLSGHVARTGKINSYNISVGNPEGKRQLEKPRRRKEDFRMDLWKIGWEGVD
jgi:hypothetical protein